MAEKTAEKKRSFAELLNEAPMAAQEDVVRLVGTLGRSNQSGKFVLTMGAGNSVMLDVDAVKAYQVIGGGVGQMIVQVEVDRERVPNLAQVGAIPQGGTLPLRDIKHPILDKYPWEEPVKYVIESTGTIQEAVGNPYGNLGDPYQLAGGYGGAAMPFALATPHQAPYALAAMPVYGTGFRDTWHTLPRIDAGATGVPPYLD